MLGCKDTRTYFVPRARGHRRVNPPVVAQRQGRHGGLPLRIYRTEHQRLAGTIPTKMSVSNPTLSGPESERGYLAMLVLAPAVRFGQRVQSRDALCVGEDYV